MYSDERGALANTGLAGITIGGVSYGLDIIVGVAVGLIIAGALLLRWQGKRRARRAQEAI